MSKWLRGLQLSPLPSADTTAASTDTETRGGSQTTVETAVGEESCVDKCSADSSSLHCRRLTPPPPPPTPTHVAAADTTVNKCSSDSSSLHCRRMKPLPHPPTPTLTHVAAAARLSTKCSSDSSSQSTAVG